MPKRHTTTTADEVTVTVDDVLRALRDLAPYPTRRGVTVRELATRAGRSTNAVRTMLREALDAGLIEVQRERRTRIDGIVTLVPVYRHRPLTQRKSSR